MRVVIETLSGISREIENITELSFIQSADAACDSLSVCFRTDEALDETVAVKGYNGDRLVFNGFCDCQKTTFDKNGFEVYIYARSSAGLLIDNEAEPYTYSAPTARQLSFCYAEPLGFSCRLPDIYSSEKYQVLQGTSCFGAINQFVYFCTGSNIFVNPENEICIFELSRDCKSLDSEKVLSLTSVINRSEPLKQINFKKSLNSNGYELHTCAGYADKIGVNKSQYVNLASFAGWQREYTVLQKLRKSYDSYKMLEIVVSGFVDENLYQRFSYSSANAQYDDYALIEKRYICDKNGERTKLKLRKIIDVKENTYVD